MQKLDGQLITIFGGGGFVGRYVVEQLLAQGARVRVAQRDPHQATYLRALANLGQIQFVRADVRDQASVLRAMQGSVAAVNLVGSFDNMQSVQADGAGHIAQAAEQAGVTALVHISAIGADPQSPSLYGRSKADGEAAVRTAFPKAVILRPSIIFGREDKFVNRFAKMVQYSIVPVVGADARFQPVYVGDVAQAVAAALNPVHDGKTFELAGPQPFTMKGLLRWLADLTGRKPLFINVSGGLISSLPFSPMSKDQWNMLQVDNVPAAGSLGLADLGLTPTALESVAADWLVLYREKGRFADERPR
jgi:uncharacterized protein YbjT (DUF2867 family)